MDSDQKSTLLLAGMVIGGVLGLSVVLATCVARDAAIDAGAPVVESCVKHPATRSPFRGQQ